MSELNLNTFIAAILVGLLALLYYCFLLLRRILQLLERDNGKTDQKFSRNQEAEGAKLNAVAAPKVQLRKVEEEIPEQITPGVTEPEPEREPVSREKIHGQSSQTKQVRIIVTEIEKRTSVYNQIREKKLSEDVLVFKRVRLEFISGNSLADLGRERYFEEHSSGNCLVVRASDNRYLLYPHFRSRRLDKDSAVFFEGEPEFVEVKRPAICQRIGEKYKVIEHGSLI